MSEELPAWSLSAEAVESIALPEEWPGQITREWAWGGATGAGARVCVLDSGIETDHPLVGDVQKSVAQLVLTLVELIRQLLERQAIRRMEAGTLTDDETESVGLALMRLHETIQDLARDFDISPDELNLDLGPAGKLM